MHRNNRLTVVARFKNCVVHAYADLGLICSRKNGLFLIKDLANPRMEPIASIPWKFLQQLAHIRLLDRYLKFSILQVHKTQELGYLASTGHSWWHISYDGAVSNVAHFPNTQPMKRGICESKTGITYVAEYLSNQERNPVRIFRSTNLEQFDVAWEFGSKSIRHIHALIVDPEMKNRIWVLTGDWDNESGFFFTDDDFGSLQCYLMRGQQTRATDVILRDGSLYWGMDSPSKTSFILRASKDQPDIIEELCELPGPAYYMGQNQAGGMYLATTVERGPGVKDKVGHMFGTKPDGSWEEIMTAKKDYFPQFGIFYFPRGVLPENFVVFSQRALKPFEGYLTIARDRLWP